MSLRTLEKFIGRIKADAVVKLRQTPIVEVAAFVCHLVTSVWALAISLAQALQYSSNCENDVIQLA